MIEDDAHTYLFDHQLLNDSTNKRYIYISPIEQSRSNERDKEKETEREKKEENEQIDRTGTINSMTNDNNRMNHRTLEQKVNIYPISTTIDENTSYYGLYIPRTIDESHTRPSDIGHRHASLHT